MTSLRLRMLEDMQIRNLAVNTQESYVQQVSLFARYFNRSPEQLGPEEIRTYQVYLTKEKKLATGSILIAISALRFLYKSLSKGLGLRRHHPRSEKTSDSAGGPQSRGSPTVSGLCGEPETPCHLDHLLRRRLARLRSHCSYTPRHRQQAHGRAGRTRQGNEGSLRDALSKTAVLTSVTLTIAAATDIAPSASPLRVPNGSKNGKRKFSQPRIFMSSSPSLNRSRLLLTKTKISSTAFCSEPPPKPCLPSLPIPNISAPKSASSPCSTVGDKISSFIPTCIVSSRVAESHPMVAGGFLAAPVFFCPYGCCPACSADCS